MNKTNKISTVLDLTLEDLFRQKRVMVVVDLVN